MGWDGDGGVIHECIVCDRSNLYDKCSHIYIHNMYVPYPYSVYCLYISTTNYPTATAVTFKSVSSLSLHYNLLENKRHTTGNSLPFFFVVNGTPRKCWKAVIIIFLKILK
jgi:hypothetical protein